MYLLTQWWHYLLLAALIGFAAGWWQGRSGRQTDRAAETAAESAEPADAAAPLQQSDAAEALARELDQLRWRARYFEARTKFLEQGAASDAAPAPAIPEITNASFTPSAVAQMDPASLEAAVAAAGEGVKPAGLPKNEAWLHAQGLFHFWQIATLDVAGVAWLSRHLPTFGSRVYRENWVDQATRLARGEGKDAFTL
jgi:predicted flap endonuclease-1-like 5' DNA nuclease